MTFVFRYISSQWCSTGSHGPGGTLWGQLGFVLNNIGKNGSRTGATVSKITKVLFTDSCRWKNVCPSLLCLVDSTQLFTRCKRLGQKFCLMQWSVNGRAQFLCYFPNVMRIIRLKNCQCDYMIIMKKKEVITKELCL